jgi:uncharacterized protein DUF3592
MLIEIWERLRGYDKWTEAEVTIESSDLLSKGSRYGIGYATPKLASREQIDWSDSEGRRRSAEFEVDDESPLYQLLGGERVTIRYNPARPGQYYFRDLLRSRVRRFFQILLRSFLRHP